ncbi:Uncharacterised protein [Mycobacterium tuberculosis]|uniref:Uncharacterized protein n=1 Tax=Mycobacterium tuberculosis TaxID=1773 RepID=A0A0U0U4J2_MYCTX|nr:Uncharacterised protein [Mycobacterium tuberculosis]COY54727.1 Uncharacterised protein [Mycobacterium tuberculosis]
MALVDVIGDFVHTVAQVEAVKQDMQRDLADRPLFAQVGRQSTRRIGHHHNGHRRRSPPQAGGAPTSSLRSASSPARGMSQPRDFSFGTPASASALSISSATAWWASKFQ